MPQVQVIEPVNSIYRYSPPKLRVCAYARVSSDSADQLNSFSVQMEHYTSLIAENDEWELVDIYADEGITGTRSDKREEFQRMLSDCRKGKIDRILVKSVSRFARNIHDCLSTVRELKALGVEVEFEEDGIKTADMHDEMMIGAFSSIAQEESTSISNNMRWSYARRMQNGNFTCCCPPYGYDLINNILIPNPKEAPMVRRIFGSYLSGKSMEQIASELNADGIPCKNGEVKWLYTAVSYILKSERYIGDALLQKSYTTDTMPFQTKRNKGERDRYYITGSHEPIISRSEFEQAQRLMKARNSLYPNKGRGRQYTFSQKIRCGKCGTNFSRRVTNGKTYWVCHRHFRSKELCEIRQIREDAIIQASIRMVNKLKQNSRYILSPALTQLMDLKSKISMSDAKVGSINKEIAELTKQSLVLNRLRTKGYMDSAVFMQKNNEINQQLDLLKRNRRRLLESDADDEMISDCKLLIELMEQGSPYLTAFDEALFHSIVNQIVVTEQDKLKFCLIGGFAFTEQLPKEVFGR